MKHQHRALLNLMGADDSVNELLALDIEHRLDLVYFKKDGVECFYNRTETQIDEIINEGAMGEPVYKDGQPWARFLIHNNIKYLWRWGEDDGRAYSAMWRWK